MNAITRLLKDRHRSQRGSVLSGVLIMTSFLAIIAGALMTELSTNFLLSTRLGSQISNQAAVDSAMELATNQLETTAISAGCPALPAATLNGRTAAVAYTSCWPVVDSRSPQSTAVAGGSTFNVDGSHSPVPRANQDLYIVGDSAGNVFQFPFGGSSDNWSWALPSSSVTGPPVVLPDLGNLPDDLLNLVPLRVTSNPPQGCSSGYCVAMLAQDVGRAPDKFCYMGTTAAVTTRAALGVNFPTVAFVGDQGGSVYAFTATENGNCTTQASAAGTQSVVAGPLVFAGPVTGNSKTDEVYVVVSDGSSSSLLRYAYTVKNSSSPTLTRTGSLPLPAPNAVGLTGDATTLPARVAISFAGGQVTLVQLGGDYSMLIKANAQIQSTLGGTPFWCHCSGTDQIGVIGTTGAMYLLDSNLNLLAASGALGSGATAPASDSVGDWFYGASDGYVHELQQSQSASTLSEVARFALPGGAAVTSAVQVSSCTQGICIYLAAQDGNVYLVPLDARDITATACIGSTPQSCSGANPRLWAKFEVGGATDRNVVHVQGWSYYSA